MFWSFIIKKIYDMNYYRVLLDSDFFFLICLRLEEKDPSQVDTFKTNMNKVMKDILGRFKDLQFFTGKSLILFKLIN